MTRRSPPRHRRAFTLLELLVVLVILGIVAAVAAPTLRLPGPPLAESSLERARALAIRRAETVRLQAAADGTWTVVAIADTTNAVLAQGEDEASGAASQTLVSPLGTCLPVGPGALRGGTWDPVQCVLSAR